MGCRTVTHGNPVTRKVLGREMMMETHPLEIAAEQVVRWLLAEQLAGRRELRIDATRSFLIGEIPSAAERGLGDEESEDLTEVTTIGLLEVKPKHNAEDWVLKVRVEDPLAARLPGDASVADVPEEIDLATFHTNFIVPDRGTMYVSVETASEAAWDSLNILLNDIRRDSHRK